MNVWKSVVLAVPLVTTACTSTTSDPSQRIAVARTALSSAEDTGARELAEVDLRQAAQKLERAESARQDKNFKEALHLAEQAEIDARYASFKARSSRSSRVVEELEKGIEQLRAEVARSLEAANAGGDE